jgi:hypothetical protein
MSTFVPSEALLMSCAFITSINVGRDPGLLSGPHQLTSMAPTPDSAIQRAWRSITAVDRES